MLRDKNLIPLSHQHQHCLALCVRLDRALQAGGVDLEAWQAEIQQIFEQEITFHLPPRKKSCFRWLLDFRSCNLWSRNFSPGTFCCVISFRALPLASCMWPAYKLWSRSW